MEKAELLRRLAGTGQEPLLDHYDDLSATQKASFTHQLTELGFDWAQLRETLQRSLAALHGSPSGSSTREAALSRGVAPPPGESIFSVAAARNTDRARLVQLEGLGAEAIAQGQAAVLILAGGSGVRLGISTPKGLFHCPCLRQQKSLFQFHCEKIRRMQAWCQGAQRDAAVQESPLREPRILLLIMVSAENAEATQAFFTEHQWFGLEPTQVLFFSQGVLPCFDAATGQALCAAPGVLCLAPNGNGGVYQSLCRPPLPAHSPNHPSQECAAVKQASVLDELRRWGVRYVQICSVDNLLVRLADPVFYGYAIDSDADVVVKTTPKLDPDERVGVFAKLNGTWGVIEYTELGPSLAAARDPDTGELLYNCANIACHVCSVDFLARAAEHANTPSSLFFHAAQKRIATVSGPVTGIKLEAFIFDLFHLAQRRGGGEAFRIMQVDRAEEFAPIKNGSGPTDTPQTAARALLQLHTRWALEALSARLSLPSYKSLEARLGKVLAALREGQRWVEISPLVSFQGEGLEPYFDFLVERLLHGTETIILIEKPTVSSSQTDKFRPPESSGAAKM